MATTWQRCSSFPRPCRTVFRLRSRDGRMPRWMARLRPTPTDPSRSFPTCRRRRSLPPPTGQRTRGTTRYLGVFPFSSLPLHSFDHFKEILLLPRSTNEEKRIVAKIILHFSNILFINLLEQYPSYLPFYLLLISSLLDNIDLAPLRTKQP